MSELPDALQPATIATPRNVNTVMFLTPASPLSHLHPCKMTIEGQEYNCVEQYYGHTKAKEARDEQREAQILKETDPFRIMNLHGGIILASWTTRRACEVLQLGNTAKFEQNADLRAFLLDTGSRRIGEASRSAKWGTGVKLHHRDQLDTTKWTGENQAGKVIQQVRETLK